MKVRLSGPVKFIEVLDTVVSEAPGESRERSVNHRESLELRFGFHEFAEIVTTVKDIAELVGMCWGALEVLKRTSALSQATQSARTLPLELTTTTKRVSVELPIESSKVEIQQVITSALERHGN